MCNAAQAVYDAKSEEIGPGIYRFKAEIGQSHNIKLDSCHCMSMLNAPCLQPLPAVHCLFIAFCSGVAKH